MLDIKWEKKAVEVENRFGFHIIGSHLFEGKNGRVKQTIAAILVDSDYDDKSTKERLREEVERRVKKYWLDSTRRNSSTRRNKLSTFA